MKKSPLLLGMAATAMLLIGSPAAKAVHLKIGLANPTSTFTFDLSGYTSTSDLTGVFIVNPQTATFGATTVFPVGTDPANPTATITMTSGETINGNGSLTDTFTVSTPSNFITGATYSGIQVLQFDLGNSNSGGGAVQILGPVTLNSQTGSYKENTGSNSFGLTMFQTVVNSGTTNSSYYTNEGVNAGSSISGYGVDSFTYSITYNGLVPEPSSWAMLGMGAILGGGAILRRRSAS